MAERQATDPVAALSIEELTASMAFHALAVAVVDLAVGLAVTAGRLVPVDPGDLLVRLEGVSVVEVVVPVDRDNLRSAVAVGTFPDRVGRASRGGCASEVDDVVSVAGPADVADLPGRLASWLVAALDPLVAAVEPVEPAQRWGAVADLVAVLALVRQRLHHLPIEAVWATVSAVIDELRALRPHPTERPTRLAVPVAGCGDPLALARRSTCCQWHRAARQLDEGSVADARCADCPSLDAATSVTRLAALAACGDLAAP